MYDLILPCAERTGAEKLVLEVITENVPAIKSYEKFVTRLVVNLNVIVETLISKSYKGMQKSVKLQILAGQK